MPGVGSDDADGFTEQHVQYDWTEQCHAAAYQRHERKEGTATEHGQESLYGIDTTVQDGLTEQHVQHDWAERNPRNHQWNDLKEGTVVEYGKKPLYLFDTTVQDFSAE